MNTSFHPDLIIEVTSVCDRACIGCYAPNIINKLDPKKFYDENKNLFLSDTSLESALLAISSPFETVSVRGGEPSQHPELVNLFSILSERSSHIFLETHGRWLLDTADQRQRNQLLQSIKDNSVTVKLSFDRMHGLSALQLRDITAVLEDCDIGFVVAITEESDEAFFATLSQCDFVSREKIIFQRKAKQLSDLVRPKIGVINVKGDFSGTLSVRPTFLESTAPGRKTAI